MKVLRTTDIVTLKHGELEVDFSPLPYDKSLELANQVKLVSGKTLTDSAKQTALMIKYAVKEVRGLTDWHNDPIVVKAGVDGLSEDDVSTAVSALIRTPFIAPLAKISSSAVPEPFDGVTILINKKEVELGK